MVGTKRENKGEKIWRLRLGLGARTEGGNQGFGVLTLLKNPFGETTVPDPVVTGQLHHLPFSEAFGKI